MPNPTDNERRLIEAALAVDVIRYPHKVTCICVFCEQSNELRNAIEAVRLEREREREPT